MCRIEIDVGNFRILDKPFTPANSRAPSRRFRPTDRRSGHGTNGAAPRIPGTIPALRRGVAADRRERLVHGQPVTYATRLAGFPAELRSTAAVKHSANRAMWSGGKNEPVSC
jgi:hypothetical protein